MMTRVSVLLLASQFAGIDACD